MSLFDQVVRQSPACVVLLALFISMTNKFNFLETDPSVSGDRRPAARTWAWHGPALVPATSLVSSLPRDAACVLCIYVVIKVILMSIRLVLHPIGVLLDERGPLAHFMEHRTLGHRG